MVQRRLGPQKQTQPDHAPQERAPREARCGGGGGEWGGGAVAVGVRGVGCVVAALVLREGEDPSLCVWGGYVGT